MTDKTGIATIAIVLLLLMSSAGVAVTDPSHFATSGTVYQTNSGLEVQLGDDRQVEAVPFADDNTFASDGVEIESAGPSRVRLTDQAFDGDTMSVRDIDASSNDIVLRRDNIENDYTVDSGISDVTLHEATLDDGAIDIEIVADSKTNITVTNLPDVDNVQAVDQNGNVVASGSSGADGQATFTFDTGTYQVQLQDAPDTLEIRYLTTGDLVTEDADGNPLNVTVEFFGDDGGTEERIATDGTIDMSGLPADERFAVNIQDNNSTYVQRQAIIPSVLQQDTVWLLPDSSDIETVQPRFVLEDPTNQFDLERSEIVLERPVEINGTTEFVAVAGDRVGLNGYEPILEKDQRYRLTVTDPESGSQRELGELTPTRSEQITLTVQDVEFDSVSETEGIDWTARYITNEESADDIEFIFRDQFETESIDYKIVERDNESNVLVDSSASGNVTVTETVPPGEEGTVWEVQWTTTRANGDTLSATRPVSTDRLPVGPALDGDWQVIFSMIGLFVVAGLFGAANPGIGGIAVASTGGMFYFIGWLPDSTGGLMVIVALFIAVLSYAGRKARGATA